MSRTRAVTVTSFLLAVALLGLALTAGISVLAIGRSNARVTEARAVLISYSGLQRAVGGEAFAEAGYRRAPSAIARARVNRALSEVDRAIDTARVLGSRRDGALLSYLQLLNDRYAAEIRSTLDTPDPGKGNDRVAGPTLDAIQELIDGAVTGHRNEASTATAEQQALLRQLGLVLPAVFLLALGTLTWSWRQMLREHRRLRLEAADSEGRALTDPLTGLANRAALARVMDDVLARPAARAALLFLDLDHFKPVNDVHGHHVGDAVLREVAERINDVVRPGDVVARLGGDEFAVFLPSTDDPDAVACKIIDALRLPMLVAETVVSVGTSIGIATAARDGRDRAALLQSADAALYRAKSGGRGRARTSRRLEVDRSLPAPQR